ncbi:MAG: M48 family metalloprotease [Thaumarchaeota archaeon]|nr:M48 family metalloprotease [Nitrososphaerota archaeon]
MSPGSAFLRFWFGATPFASAELDALADHMSVSGMLSRNPGDRWFRGPGITAYTRGSRVVFGFELDKKLNDAQKLAVAAHELIHVRERDARHAFWHIDLPAIATGTAAFVLFATWLYLVLPPYTVPVVAMLGLVVGGFAWVCALVVFRTLAKPWRRKTELRCDVMAVAFVDGDDLLAALRLLDTLLTPKLKRKIAYKLWKSEYPVTYVREAAIRKTMAVNSTSHK